MLSSLTTLFAAFTKYSEAFRLQENLHKSEVYLAGVSSAVADHIVEVLGVPPYKVSESTLDH